MRRTRNLAFGEDAEFAAFSGIVGLEYEAVWDASSLPLARRALELLPRLDGYLADQLRAALGRRAEVL